ncbi:MAG: tetratricopeptide repeat protein, partial [Chloroflexi bacterium]|nr:tetratricopeptide repeat protein [Chloroflexota bacterium]
MLDAAAVLGQEFDLSILQGMTAVPETELVALLERAIAVRIVADHSEFGAERFAFSDDQIQEVLYAALSGPRRRRLHRQAGMALEQRFGEQTSGYAEQLARHFGEGADLERGARYARQAGEAAEQVYAWAPAARWYRTALAQWERLGSHLSERASLCERLGDLYHRTALDARLAAGYLEQAIDLAEQMGDRTRAAGTRFYLGRSLAMSADIGMTDQERALTELHRARTTLEDLPESELLGWVFIMIGAIHGYLLQLPERVVWLDRALGVADRLGLPALRANVEANLGVSFYLQGDVARGLNIVEGAWEQAAQKGLAFPADRARSNLVLSLTNLDPRLGLAWADRSPDFHTYPSRIEIPGSRCCQLARMGDFAAADQLMRRLLETLEDSGLRLPGIIPFDVGQFYYCRGEWETARDLLEEVWALFKRTKNDNWAVRSAIPLGEVYLELGEDALAEELLEWTAARCREGGAQLPLVQAQLLRAVLAARQGRAAEAAAILDDAQTLLGAIDDLGAHMGVAARAEAIVRAAQGRWSEAETAFLRSIEIAQRFGLQWDEA